MRDPDRQGARGFLWGSIGRVYGVGIIGFLAGALTTILFGRLLPLTEMGLFILFKSLVDLLIPLSLLGRDSAILKFLSHRDIDEFQWFGELRRDLLVAGILATSVAVGLRLFYSLPHWTALGAVVASISGSALLLLSCLERSQERYTRAALMTSLAPILMLILGIPVVLWTELGVSGVLGALFASYPLALLFGARLSRAGRGRSGRRFPKELRRYAWIFLFMSAGAVALEKGIQVMVPQLLSYADLAGYGILLGLFGAFPLARTAIASVLTTHLAREPKFRMGRHFFALLLVGLGIGALYVLAGPMVLHFLFDGKYDHVSFLIPIFSCVGVFQILATLPAALIGGRSSEATLLPYALGITGAGALGLLLTVPLALSGGLAGVAHARWIGAGATAAVGYFILWRQPGRSRYAVSDSANRGEHDPRVRSLEVE